MSLSTNLVKTMLLAAGDRVLGNEHATAINTNSAVSDQTGWTVPAAIVATHVSTTTDFGALKVGDLVVCIPAVAGNAIFYTVVTAGTLPAAAVIGSLYVVCRAFTAPAASAVVL